MTAAALSAVEAITTRPVEGSASMYGVLLRCPQCASSVHDLACTACGYAMPYENGIVRALLPHRAQHYARFMAEYERIRAMEGRGSKDRDFYLALPYKDLSGCNGRQWQIRASSFTYLLRRVLSTLGRGATVLDLGSGNCWMSYRMAMEGYSPIAADLLVNAQDGLGAAVHYEPITGAIPRFQAEAAHLPFRDAQLDAVVFNASFHYAEDYEAVLREALRCLKPGGLVVVCDTPWYRREESGRQMVAERQVYFQQRFGTASDSIRGQEYLTDARLQQLEKALSLRWTRHTPWHGWKWALRPLVARLQRKREPSRFHIYVARKHV